MKTRRKQVEPRGDYADDGVVLPVEGNAFAQNIFGGIEFSAPQTLADERDRARARQFFGLRKRAPKNGIDTQQREKVCGHKFSIYLLGFAFSGQTEGVTTRNRH